MFGCASCMVICGAAFVVDTACVVGKVFAWCDAPPMAMGAGS